MFIISSLLNLLQTALGRRHAYARLLCAVIVCTGASAASAQNHGLIGAFIPLLLSNAPTVSITSPTQNAVFGPQVNIPVTASASATVGDTITKVEFYVGSSTLIGTATIAPYSITWSTPVSGLYSITARATDNEGNATISSAVNVTVDLLPTVAITAPANNALLASPATVNLTATASDSDGTISKVEFYRGTTLVATKTTAPYTATDPNLPSGTYSYTAKAYDNLGGTTTSSAVTVTSDILPTVSIAANVVNSNTIAITGNAADADGTVVKVDLYQGSTLIATLTNTPYSFTWNNVAPGGYTLTAVATDNNGGTTSATVNVAEAFPIYYIHTDHLNTPRLLTNQAQQAVWRWDHAEPFGTYPANENPSGLGAFEFNQRFPGQYFDKETNTHYNYMRDYDPAIGRYVESDPIGLAGGINTYAYVRGNPLSYRDPSGLQIPAPPIRIPPIGGPTPGRPGMSEIPREPAPFWPKWLRDLANQICPPDDDKQRCREVLKTCRDECSDKFVDDPNSLPGTGTDLPGRLRRCIRECMERSGCYDF